MGEALYSLRKRDYVYNCRATLVRLAQQYLSMCRCGWPSTSNKDKSVTYSRLAGWMSVRATN